MPRVLSVWFLFLISVAGYAQVPIATDPDKYKLVLENEQVRVLEYTDAPGQRTSMHRHSDFVLYALSSFKRQLTFPDGQTVTRQFEPGDVVFMKEQSHIGSSVGDTKTRVLIVEVKQGAHACSPEG